MFTIKSIIRFAILAPIIVILLTIGWYQQAIDHVNIFGNTLLTDYYTDSYIIAGYFINWGIYDRNFNVVDLEVDKLSHVLYAFANVNLDGTIVLGDSWADTDIRFSKDKTVDGIVDSWKENDKDLHGNFKQLALLKQQNRHLKVSLSIGGYSWSSNFSVIASTPETRSQFANTAVNHVKNLGLDGIDIDWEFPKDQKDAENYVLLLEEVRKSLDDYQRTFDPTDESFILSVAMPCGPENYRILKLDKMAKYVDIFYLMAYDFAGSWDKVTGHQSNLYGGALNVNQAVTDFEKAGIPSKKIVMGIPMYGRAFSNTNSEPGSIYKGVPNGSWEKGSFDYKDLPRQNAKEFIDKSKGASWSYSETNQEFVTYDTPVVVEVKCEYIKNRKLGGVMFWELSADVKSINNSSRSLLNTAYLSLGDKLNTVENHILFPLSEYKNIPHFS
ncbi:chitinase [Cokeromyces recurvatus]|uniref:chitinase n=1 Tax=Cokeromyces recurvatus TaxID=90255 RepID=UPI00221FFF53|nr:chitinase [Cokeromyces recurvatus]KAI7906530.1 chitinase [Cokeromyces recurvatus]